VSAHAFEEPFDVTGVGRGRTLDVGLRGHFDSDSKRLRSHLVALAP